MSYATRAQVIARIGRLAKSVSETTVPSLSDIDGFIADRAGQIDRVLNSRGLSTPVTAPAAALADLAFLNAEGAAADAFMAVNMTNDDGSRNAGALKLRSYEATLAAWVKGEGLPVGLATVEADLAVRSPWTGPNGCPVEPLFSRLRRWP